MTEQRITKLDLLELSCEADAAFASSLRRRIRMHAAGALAAASMGKLVTVVAATQAALEEFRDAAIELLREAGNELVPMRHLRFMTATGAAIEHRRRQREMRTRPGDGKVRKVRDRRARQLAHALQFVQPVPQRLGSGTVMVDGKVVGTVKEAWVSMPYKRRKKRKKPGISWPMDPCIVQMAALLFGGKPR